jgi:hypothetical protein
MGSMKRARHTKADAADMTNPREMKTNQVLSQEEKARTPMVRFFLFQIIFYSPSPSHFVYLPADYSRIIF